LKLHFWHLAVPSLELAGAIVGDVPEQERPVVPRDASLAELESEGAVERLWALALRAVSMSAGVALIGSLAGTVGAAVGAAIGAVLAAVLTARGQ
jgi:hypothetical protein